MGYQSNFEVRVLPMRPPDPNVVRYYPETPLLKQVSEAINAEVGWGLSRYPPDADYLSIYDITWYEFENDFRAVSQRFPNAVLEVTRYGEDDGDIERRFFHNGRAEGGKAEIRFPSNPVEVVR